MKVKIAAALMLLITIGFVTVNTALLGSMIYEIRDEVNLLDVEAKDLRAAEAVYDKFTRYETYVSITVSHDDLTNIENSFSELIGYISVGDIDNAEVIKRKLSDALEHLYRLSGVNLDSII